MAVAVGSAACLSSSIAFTAHSHPQRINQQSRPVRHFPIPNLRAFPLTSVRWEVVNSKITERDQHDIIILGEALLCKSRSNDEKVVIVVVIVWNMYIKAIKMGKGAMWEKGVWGEIISFGSKSLGAWVVLISMKVQEIDDMEWTITRCRSSGSSSSTHSCIIGIYRLLMEQDVRLVTLTFDTMRVPYAKG
ncbi:hypothetical protein IW261DRAFT_1420997 [Armillaria novae-zelandiae]|uniref:Uncharacterized protein n=1 Tax=Armillaria novae-zelandiae TaxID=153914 RepID=A0AA39TB44_9AGAR|nr:hypothetical protein IW261DRAFT_1420997 [Armillaria novae-zelandiae]